MGVRFSRTLSIVVGACAAMLSTPSMAADLQLGTLQSGTAKLTGGNIGTFYNQSDRVFFTLGTPSDLASSTVKGMKITLSPIPGLTLDSFLTSLTADLYKASGAFVYRLADISGPATQQATTLSGLASGNYYINVAGQALNPLLGGTYALALTSTQAAAAPGPAGILFVGGAAALMAGRRRRQKAKLALA